MAHGFGRPLPLLRAERKSTISNAVSVTYTLFNSIVGVFIDEQVVITLPIGAVLEVSSSVAPVGIIEVRYNGRMMRVFAICWNRGSGIQRRNVEHGPIDDELDCPSRKRLCQVKYGLEP